MPPRIEDAPVPLPVVAEDAVVGRGEEDGFRLRAIIALLGSPARRVPIVPVVIAAAMLSVAAIGLSLLVMSLVDAL